MASYVNPIDLLQNYLQPLTGAAGPINTGFEQGIKEKTLRQAAEKEAMMMSYYKTHGNLYNAQAIKLAEEGKAKRDALARFSGGRTDVPFGAGGEITPQWLLDFITAGGKNPELLFPTTHPVPDAGGVQVTNRAGTASSFVPTTGLSEKLTPGTANVGENIVNVLRNRAGQATVETIPMSTVTSPEIPLAAPDPTRLVADEFLFGREREMPSPTVRTERVPAVGLKFKPEKTPAEIEAEAAARERGVRSVTPKEGKKLTIGHREQVLIGDQVITQEVVGFNDNGSPIWKEVGRGAKFKEKTAEEENVAKVGILKMADNMVAERFLDFIPADKKQPVQAAFMAANQLGGSINPALVRDALPTDALKKRWDRMRILVSDYVRTMNPSRAYEKAFGDVMVEEGVELYKKNIPLPSVSPVTPPPASSSSPGPVGMSKNTTGVQTTTVGGEKKKATGEIWKDNATGETYVEGPDGRRRPVKIDGNKVVFQ